MAMKEPSLPWEGPSSLRCPELVHMSHARRSHRSPRRSRLVSMLAAGALTVGLTTPLAVLALESPASAVISTIPANFLTAIDSGGANDVNSEQNDVTQFGRDDTTNPNVFDIFWSWDTTNFTAQTGNACALFDSNNDGGIDFATCAEIHNVPSGNTSVVQQTTSSPIAATCNNSKTDRCAGPTL